MSVEATAAVLDRTMNDDAFLDRLRAEPEAALEGYDLTEDERAALATENEERPRDHLGDVALAVAVVVLVVGF